MEALGDSRGWISRRVLLLVLVCIPVLLSAGELTGARAVPGAGWVQVNPSPGFDVRESPTSLVFDDGSGAGIWVIGGWKDSGVFFNDVWKSPDGITWTQANPGGAVFEPRYGHTSLVFDDGSGAGARMWVMGGNGETSWSLNDVWSSPDGSIWTQAPAAAVFSPRYGHTSLVFDDGSGAGAQMWVIGGVFDDGSGNPPVYFNDVWNSTDGITWTRATVSAGFSPRYGHTSVVFGGRIWVIGGSDGSVVFNDSWYSADGISWTQANASAGFSPRNGHTSVVSDGRIWVIGGSGNGKVFHDVWSSPDGVFWTQATPSAPFPARFGHASVAFGSKIWVIAGNSFPGPYLNDVWSSTGFDEPTVSDIDPPRGSNDGPIWISKLSGTGFLNGATVHLARAGEPDIAASDVNVTYLTEINCTFDLNGRAVGPYDVVVTNFDGQRGTLINGFDVIYPVPPSVTGINPAKSSNLSPVNTSISGTGFYPGAAVKLTRAGQADIPGYNVDITPPDRINCTFDLTDRAVGLYDVVVANLDGQSFTLTGGFNVTPPPPSVTSISPQTGFPEGRVTLNINGMFFVGNATVKPLVNLVLNYRQYINATNVTVISGTLITCDFDVTGATNATWDVEVINPDGQSSLASNRNNIFQFIVYAAKTVTGSSTGTQPSGGGGGGSGIGYTSSSAAAAYKPAPEALSPTGTGRTAGLQIDSQGVTTHETVLQSGDTYATVSIPVGTVAKDAARKPLTSVSIAPVPESAVPPDTPGSKFAFAGRAYELGPDGATFSHAITLSFTVTGPGEGQTYTIRMFDDATDAWVDLPTSYHPDSNTVTTEVSGFCCFALFAEAPVAPVATTAPPRPTTSPQPVPTPQPTAISIFSGVLIWGMNLIVQHPVIIPAIIILAAAIFFSGRKRRRRLQVDRVMGGH